LAYKYIVFSYFPTIKLGTDVLKVGVATHFTKSENIPALEAAILETKSRADIETVLKSFCTNRTDEFSLTNHKKQIEHCFSAKTVEEIIENLRSDGSEWANTTISMMNKMSPTSLKITKEQLERGGQMDNLKDCLRMEYRLTQRVTDFGEGIRALIIDKDQNPKWQPKRLQDVSEAYVESFFEPLAKELTFD
jgi:3-hydroxyisobutyryl-CoA hydrolase